jgi:AraC-like DNA-binding protein
MKPQFEDINSKKGTNSYLAYRYGTSFFPFLWHYHPEYELTLILEGSGKRMVGDSLEYFVPGDLVLLGPGLPHTWISEEPSAAVVIQFSEAFVAPFLQYPECDRLFGLLARSSQGLYFPPKEAKVTRGRLHGGMRAEAISDAISMLPVRKGTRRITCLLDILQTLAGGASRALASPYFQPSAGRRSEDRIAKVFQYIHRHSSEEVPLKKIAALINLSESAFCKFFKRTTGKTFSDYLADIRVGHACHLLSESDDTIAGVAYLSGFDSLTYFNRVFLRKKGMRPREFRQRLSGTSHNGGVPVRRGKS